MSVALNRLKHEQWLEKNYLNRGSE
jgi:hypothetical protein